MTPNKRRWLSIAAAVIVAVTLTIAGYTIFWPKPSAPLAGSPLDQIRQHALTDPSTGVQPYGAVPVDYQKQDAVLAHQQYPEYYGCRAYPSNTSLTQADLVPTANVVVTITYDKHSKKYVVSGDSRVTVHETDAVEPADSDIDQPFRSQKFSFGFAGDVHYFGAFSRYLADDGLRWGAVTLYGTDQANGRTVPNYYLPLSPGNGPSDPMYVIIATDTRTCHAGKVSVPAEFSWKQLASDGLLLPEFYDAGIHPQG